MTVARAAPAAKPWRYNPTLAVLAYFMVPVDGDMRRTRLPLRDHPDVAAWLLTVLDYILSKQGKLPGDKPIAEPPGGATRQRLIDGRVILAAQRPDGGLALRLNPEFDLRLEINARRRGMPACNTQITLAEQPDLTRWLLAQYLADSPGIGPPLNDALLESLRLYGVLINEPPPDDAWFPDPAAPANIAAELAPMARVFTQPAGQPIPAEVRRILGRHTPALPPDADIVWGEDAGTGMVYPSLWRAGGGPQPDVTRLAGTDTARRATAWARQREDARVSFRTRGFAVLRDIFPPAQRDGLRRYVRQLKEGGYFPELGDGQVALRASIHNEPTIASLHNGLAGIVNTIGEEPVIPSYSFLSCYEEGAVLDRHLDRPQCKYNVCFVLDMQDLHQPHEPEPWPIYLELDGKPEPALLRVGDGVFFSGANIWHWRDALPAGRRVVVCFSHYVPYEFTGSLD